MSLVFLTHSVGLVISWKLVRLHLYTLYVIVYSVVNDNVDNVREFIQRVVINKSRTR